MKIEFDIKLQAKDLYRFNIQQVYKGMQGILSIVLPLVLFAYAAMALANGAQGNAALGNILLYIGLGLVFLLYVPISLWQRVNKTITDEKNALSKTLHYIFAEDGITVSVGEEQVDFQWENIYMMKTSGDLVLVYTNRINAYILPKSQLGEQYPLLSELAHKKLEKYRIRMK